MWCVAELAKSDTKNASDIIGWELEIYSEWVVFIAIKCKEHLARE